MADDFDVGKISRTKKSPEIRILPPFVFYRKQDKEEKKRQEKRRKNKFKEDFIKHFKLDKNKFIINIVKIDEKWYLEIYNKATKNRFYQDYFTICNILDLNCKLPKIIGANIDKKV